MTLWKTKPISLRPVRSDVGDFLDELVNVQLRRQPGSGRAAQNTRALPAYTADQAQIARS